MFWFFIKKILIIIIIFLHFYSLKELFAGWGMEIEDNHGSGKKG